MECSLEFIVIENIKRIRKCRGLSQEKLAELAGTSTSYICSMENHKYAPKLSTIERIAAVLEIAAWTLFDPSAKEYIKSGNTEIMNKKEIRKAIDAALDRILG